MDTKQYKEILKNTSTENIKAALVWIGDGANMSEETKTKRSLLLAEYKTRKVSKKEMKYIQEVINRGSVFYGST